MLVLSRKPGQRIRIAGKIELTVLKVCGSVVKLGFSGPSDIPIHREEVYQRIEAEAEAENRPVYTAPMSVEL